MTPDHSDQAKQFSERFEAAVANAASANPAPVPRAEFFLPQTNGTLNRRTNAVMLAVAARRMQEVEAWLNRELAKFLPEETMALPAAERAEAIKAAGFFGREHTFPQQAPGTMNMALYWREGPGQEAKMIANMKFEPVFSGDNAKAGE